jgi:hypothetical protein
MVSRRAWQSKEDSDDQQRLRGLSTLPEAPARGRHRREVKVLEISPRVLDDTSFSRVRRASVSGPIPFAVKSLSRSIPFDFSSPSARVRWLAPVVLFCDDSSVFIIISRGLITMVGKVTPAPTPQLSDEWVRVHVGLPKDPPPGPRSRSAAGRDECYSRGKSRESRGNGMTASRSRGLTRNQTDRSTGQ